VISVHLRKVRQRTTISSEEEQVIRGLVADTRRVPADKVLIRHGTKIDTSIMLLDGWLARCKDLPDGDRQVTQLHVPGDFADLHGFTLKRLDHDLTTLSECQIALVPHERILALLERFPRLARYYWFATNVDAAITRELALSLGQRSAISRMAHLFCELMTRLEVVDRADKDGFGFPLTQREIAECLGLTVVHANRTLQTLRRRKLIELENRRLTILDRKGLEEVAEFDTDYLYLDRMPF